MANKVTGTLCCAAAAGNIYEDGSWFNVGYEPKAVELEFSDLTPGQTTTIRVAGKENEYMYNPQSRWTIAGTSESGAQKFLVHKFDNGNYYFNFGDYYLMAQKDDEGNYKKELYVDKLGDTGVDVNAQWIFTA